MSNLILIAIVSLFCLNGRGLGGPVIERKIMLISDYLNEMSSSCSNAFLASEIAKASESCGIKPPQTDKEDAVSEKQLLCVMYYDINSQLCKTKLNESVFAEKYQPEVSVKDLCTESEHWTVPEIPWYPTYQTYLQGLLKDTYSCSSLCHDPNKIRHVNNVCKLYKVGYDLLHQTQPITITRAQKDETDKKHVFEVSESNEDVKPPVLHRETDPESLPRKALEEVYSTRKADPNSSTQTQTETKSAIPKTIEVPEGQGNNLEPTIAENVKAEELETVNKVAKVRAMTQINEPPKIDLAPQSELAQPIISTKPNNAVQPESKLPVDDPSDDNVREPNVPQDAVEEVAVKPEEGKVVDGKNTNVVAVPDSDNDKVKQEDMDNRGVPEGEDEEEQALEDPQLGDDDADDEFEEPQKPAAKHPVLPNSHTVLEKLPDSMQKATFPNQPDYPSDDEDHFFSFFLTVIVLVVLLYVLYHNKSKVTKVVLGLIVEGRQPGRRRNSRGHAYKRLDTLEQAMSASSTAPPAKIIY